MLKNRLLLFLCLWTLIVFKYFKIGFKQFDQILIIVNLSLYNSSVWYINFPFFIVFFSKTILQGVNKVYVRLNSYCFGHYALKYFDKRYIKLCWRMKAQLLFFIKREIKNLN